MTALPKVPVLFIVFNRPDTTERVLAEILKYKPSVLYVAADGPRNQQESLQTDRVKALIEEKVNALPESLEVKYLYHKTNRGCKKAVSSALTWFFDTAEEGIILEDDCIPSPSFFPYCAELLERYRDDQRMMMITGTNYLSDFELPTDYFFSKHFTIWGWATWKRAWKKYDIDLENWQHPSSFERIKNITNDPVIQHYYTSTFNKVVSGYYDLWDIQWVYACLFNYGLCITPTKNLISNVGYTGTYTNRKVKGVHDLPRGKVSFPLQHPKSIVPLSQYDSQLFRSMRKGVVIATISDVFEKIGILIAMKRVLYFFQRKQV